MNRFYELLSLSLSVTPIIILLLCFNPTLKKRYSAKWRYILWIAVSICLLLPFSYVKNFLVSFMVSETVQNGIVPLASVNAGMIPKINPVNLHTANAHLREALFVIYIVGVVLYVAYVIFSYIIFRRDIFRWSKFTSNSLVQKILADEKKRLNIKRNVPILISKKVLSPMLVGFLRPTLVLPSEAYTPEELSMILAHELVHLKRNDIFIKTIFMAASVIHWFNPFVHLMAKQAIKDMEQSCDDYVLNGYDVEGKRFYCNVILKMAALNNNAKGPVFSTNIISSKKNLELRIKGIFDNSKKKGGTVALAVVMLLVIISGTLFNVSAEEQQGKVSSKNDSLNEQIEVINENEFRNVNEFRNENEAENDIYYNELGHGLTDENNQPQNIESETNSVEQPVIEDTQQTVNNFENSPIKQEEIIAKETEIVIFDLNQLEINLQDSETVDKTEQ